MRRLALLLVAALAVSCGPPSSGARGPSATPLSPAQIAERSLPSVVFIQAGNRLGTGFVVWQDGRIVTNLHVIFGAPNIKVKLADGREFNDCEVLAVDERHDLAIIRIPARNLPALPLGDSDKLKPGERVVAIGHPLGLGDTVSDGLISAIREVDPEFTVIQISAPIAQGSSGGPLFSERGEVIGVSFMISEEGQNLNFAIPVNYVKPMLLSDKGLPFAEFSRRTMQAPGGPGGGGGGGGGNAPKIARQVPTHDVAMLGDCTLDEMKKVYVGIAEAIKAGAPLYNQGNHEACYRIYEGTALQLEGGLSGCAGVKAAFAAGRSRAAGLTTFTEKAWAMRDAFDGLIVVIEKKVGP